MEKNIIISLGLLVLVLMLGTLTAQKLNNWGERLQSIDLGLELGPINELQKSLSPKTEVSYQEFIAPDKDLKLKYPGDWLKIENPEILQIIALPEWKEKYNLETIFLAQKFQEEEFAQLIVYQGNFDIKTEEIIEEMKESNQKEGWEVEIIKMEVKEKEVEFEAKYQAPAGNILHSQEKIITKKGGKVYLISGFTLEKDWQKLAKEIEFVINSAQIIENY